MFAFIRAQPAIIERMLAHIETSPFIELLMRIMQLHERSDVEGVLEVGRNILNSL